MKDFARAKHRLTKHRNRVHGGRGTGAGATAPAGSKPPRHAAGAAPGGLETNAERYESSEDEAEGVLQRRSQGQDLAKLLAAAQNDVTTRPARHWSMLRALSDDQVPRNIADAFKVCLPRRPFAQVPATCDSVTNTDSGLVPRQNLAVNLAPRMLVAEICTRHATQDCNPMIRRLVRTGRSADLLHWFHRTLPWTSALWSAACEQSR